MQIFIKKMILV